MRSLRFSALAVLVAALVVSSCNPLNKMKKNAGNIKYEAVPQVLETNKGEVPVTINTTFPKEYFNKNVIFEATPVIKYEGGEVALKPVTVQGESVQDNNKVISYLSGGTAQYSDKVPYSTEMRHSELEVRVKAYLKSKSGNSVDLPTVKLADGIIATNGLVDNNPRPAWVGDNYVRVTSESKEASILYLIDQSKVRPTELKKAEITDFKQYLGDVKKDQRKELKGITVSSYASPDGPVTLNTSLSGDRGKTAEKYMTESLKKDKISDGTKSDFLSVVSTPEDWDGFKKLMEESNIQDKELVLRVLSMYSDPEVREKEIRNISKAFEEIADKILPQLRRSKLIAKVDLIGYSDEELVQLANTDPDKLKLEEILHAASLVQDNAKKIELYKKATVNFPKDWRAQNSLGFSYLKDGRTSDAKTAFEAAKALNDNATVKNNLGVVALLDNKVDEANELFTSALSAGDVVNYNLGIVNLLKGEYKQAVNYFGGANEYNAGLAKALDGQNEAAIVTLNNVKDDNAKVYYLKAVLGARTAKTDLLYNSLRSAVGKDPKLKDYAKKDAEFLKYFNDDTFKSIVQ
jgi:tetratricopeptide (TPR) repeat protein